MITWLKGLKLSLTQWLGVTGAAVIGFLVLALRLKEREAREARRKELEAESARDIGKADDAVERARKTYEAAKAVFDESEK